MLMFIYSLLILVFFPPCIFLDSFLNFDGQFYVNSKYTKFKAYYSSDEIYLILIIAHRRPHIYFKRKILMILSFHKSPLFTCPWSSNFYFKHWELFLKVFFFREPSLYSQLKLRIQLILIENGGKALLNSFLHSNMIYLSVKDWKKNSAEQVHVQCTNTVCRMYAKWQHLKMFDFV